MVDALRGDYISRGWMPWLGARVAEGVGGDLIPPLGFEPDVAYLAGLDPSSAGAGVAYVYSPQTSPFRFMRFLPAWLDRLPQPVRRGLRYAVKRAAMAGASQSRLAGAYPRMRIPFRFMHLFDFSEPLLPIDAGFADSPTVFDHLRAGGEAFFFHGAPACDVHASAVVRSVELDLPKGVRFAFLHMGDLDWAGHAHGPNSKEVAATAAAVDAALARIVERLEERLGSLRLIVFGDHGMVEVRSPIDLRPIIARIPGRAPKDYAYFLDSTFARFWLVEPELRPALEGLLRQVEGAIWLDDEVKRSYGAGGLGRNFGDLVLWAEPGRVFLPNFWQEDSHVRGMHGYQRDERGNWTAYVATGPGIPHLGWQDQPAELVQLFATFLSLLEIDGVGGPWGLRALFPVGPLG